MSGNSFGKSFVVTSFGESHGSAIGCIVDGCPPGLELSEADLQRATILADDHEITLDDLPRELTHRTSTNKPAVAAAIGDGDGVKLDDVQRLHVLEVLRQQGGNKAKTARVLGIHRRKLYRLLERFESQEASP